MIRASKDGCNTLIKFQGKHVYHNWSSGIDKSSLGTQLDKTIYLNSKLDKTTHLNSKINSENINAILNLMTDWELYENGWFIKSYKNQHLYYYLCQIGDYGYHRPSELDYF